MTYQIFYAEKDLKITWEEMPLLYYFQGEVKKTDAFKMFDSMLQNLPESITWKELECIKNNLMQLMDAKKDKDFAYKEKNKQNIAEDLVKCSTTATIKKIKLKYPNLNENTVWLWLKRYKERKKTIDKHDADHYSCMLS